MKSQERFSILVSALAGAILLSAQICDPRTVDNSTSTATNVSNCITNGAGRNPAGRDCANSAPILNFAPLDGRNGLSSRRRKTNAGAVGGVDTFDDGPFDTGDLNRAALSVQNRDGLGNWSDGNVLIDGRHTSNIIHVHGGSKIAETPHSTEETKQGRGPVMVIDKTNLGKLKTSANAHDKKVVHTLSGAGNMKEGLTLQQGGAASEAVPSVLIEQVASLSMAASPSSGTDNSNIQNTLPGPDGAIDREKGRIVQVNLATYPKVSQYTSIDSSARGYGYNGCGLVAAAHAMGGTQWVPLVGRIAQAAGKDYRRDAGIQPSAYVAALQKVFGVRNVEERNQSSLGQMYLDLKEGKVVIVDIKVNAITEFPSSRAPNYAHFARVLGMDLNKQQVYLQDTLRGGPYWTLSLPDFYSAWQKPETTSSIVPDRLNAEEKTNWEVILNPQWTSTD